MEVIDFNQQLQYILYKGLYIQKDAYLYFSNGNEAGATQTLNMSTIINNTEKNFTPAEQQVIRNAMANAGVDKVVTCKNATDGGNGTLFDFYDDNDNYLFSIDTDADGDCIVWSKH